MDQKVASKDQRVSVSLSVQAEVLTASRRRCCLCYYLTGERRLRKGQIAHLNQNRANSDFENLVFLCLEHHDEFDSHTSQSKGFIPEEVKGHRDRLYRELGDRGLPKNQPERFSAQPEPLKQLPVPLRRVIRRASGKLDYLLKPWKLTVWQDVRFFLFAYKARNRIDGICRIERLFLSDGRVAIICTQLPGNPGQSVTNSVESIAFQVCHQFNIDPSKLVWIEHYPADIISNRRWYLVSFRSRPPKSMFREPSWQMMNPENWRALGLRPRGMAGQRQLRR
jgi:hypothetical protein